MDRRSIKSYMALREAVPKHRLGFGQPVSRLAKTAGLSRPTAAKWLPVLEALEPGLGFLAWGEPTPDLPPMSRSLLRRRTVDQLVAEYVLWPAHAPLPLESGQRRVAQQAAQTVEPAPDPEPTPASDPEPTPAPDPILAAASPELTTLELVDRLRELLAPSAAPLDEEAVRRIAEQAIAEAGVGRIEVTLRGTSEPVRVFPTAGRHQVFATALRILDTLGLLALVGPAGSGKTTLGAQLAEALDLTFACYSCTQGMGEWVLTGRLGFDNEYLSTAFVDAYESGGIVLLSEFDAMNDNARLVLNTAVANGTLPLPARTDQPAAERHPDFKLIVDSNTWGLGATASYTGRDTIDLATRDRFALASLWVDYDPALEAGIPGLGQWSPPPAAATWQCPPLRESLGDALMTVRANIAKYLIPGRVLSTRNLADAGKLVEAGFTGEEVMGIYFASWEEYDRDRALEGVALRR